MKKRILFMLLIVGALTACSQNGNSYDPSSVEADTDSDKSDNRADNDKIPENTKNSIADVVGSSDKKDGSDNDSKEEYDVDDDELVFGECKAERELKRMEPSELPGDIDLIVSMYASFEGSSRFDHTDIDYHKHMLFEFIDEGTGLYQFGKEMIDKSHFLSTDVDDPRGGYNEFGYYFSMDKKQTDQWYAALYNCTQTDIDTINAKWNDDSSVHPMSVYDMDTKSLKEINVRTLPYSENEKYYFYDIDEWAYANAVQGREAILEPAREIKEVVCDGVFYYVKYEEYDNMDYYNNNYSTAGLQGTKHDAVLKWKEMDGEKFWSLYYMDMNMFPEIQVSGVGSKAVYSDYFYDIFSENDIVYLADVTHDGSDDMIVIHQEGAQDYSGHVYIQSNGSVKEIYSKSGGTVHAGGFFNWYIIERDDGWNLADELFGMWQGMGTAGFSEYYLKENGDMVEVSSISCPADDSEVDSEGFVKDDAYDRYTSKLSTLKADYYVLFRSLEDNAKPINTKPAMVFR